MNLSYEQWISALCIWREARGSGRVAQEAIWHVLLNRVNDPHKRFGSSLIDVVLRPKQFSSFNVGDPNATKFPDPRNAPDYAPWPVIMDIVSNSMGDDLTRGATNYESCNPGQLPSWADPTKVTLVVGPFRFYKL